MNDVLLIGPDSLRGLWVIIFGFREKPVALSADIEKVIHQKEIEVNDRIYLRFLWRKVDGLVKNIAV